VCDDAIATVFVICGRRGVTHAPISDREARTTGLALTAPRAVGLAALARVVIALVASVTCVSRNARRRDLHPTRVLFSDFWRKRHLSH
tara:strand:- start:5165 stop:5428 length:264 start_codon:yes stop_codon:yes gene_type:complete